MSIRDAVVTAAGDRIRWVELPGSDAPRVFLHGLGATAVAHFAEAATHPLIAGHRTLLVDLLGHGLSDRPHDFDYSLESHAGALAAALTDAGVAGAEVVAHSMGGAVAIVLADRHPELVSRLVLVDAGLDPVEPARGAPGSAGIAAYSEAEFADGGWTEVRDRAGAFRWATMRLTDRTALHRSAAGLARGTVPTLRELLARLDVPRTFLHPETDGPPRGEDGLREAGVSVVAVADCGHDIMLDAPETFASLVAAALAA
ncbi:pimeloyl-ACP methyl ester carboxylesterase [Streptomyces sp. BK022]|nr:pimeloyl-ACP methyl ester carboxylesterase [Streptomyces sp. BK022]